MILSYAVQRSLTSSGPNAHCGNNLQIAIGVPPLPRSNFTASGAKMNRSKVAQRILSVFLDSVAIAEENRGVVSV
jgi:hypothetical protein